MMARRTKLFRALVIASLIAILAVVGLTVHNSMVGARHIPWLELGQYNIDAFEKQLRADLPVGLPQDDVEAYLRREKIPFTYVDGWQPYLWVFKRDAHREFFWITGDLSIHIELDGARRVSRIKFSLSYK